MRKNNNYLEYNKVITSDNRYWNIFLINYYEYFKIDIRESQVSSSSPITYKYSRDGNHFTTIVNEQTLSSSHFFLSNKLVIHQRYLQNIYNILSSFGGLCFFITQFATIFGSYVNSRLFMADMISKNFSLKESDDDKALER